MCSSFKLLEKTFVASAVLSFAFTSNVTSQIIEEDFDANFCLIETNSRTHEEANKAAAYIKNQGGKVSVIATPRYLFGWVASELHGDLIGNQNIVAIHTSTYDKHDDTNTLTQNDRATINYFNSVVSGEIHQKVINKDVEPVWPSQGCMPVNDRLLSLRQTNMQDNCLDVPISERMVGNITCVLIFVESDGTIDPDLYTWTNSDQEIIFSAAVSSLNIWSFHANRFGHDLTLTILSYDEDDPDVVNQPYEPILRNGVQFHHLWVNPIMGKLGFSDGNVVSRVAQFNRNTKQKANADGAFTVFIPYNPVVQGASGIFPDGAFPDGWAQRGGSYFVLTFERLRVLPLTFGHEMAHLFHAPDENRQIPSCSFVFNGIQNLNSRSHPCDGSQDCIMASTSVGQTNWLCDYTPAHIGWTSLTSKPTTVFPIEDGLVATGNVRFQWHKNVADSSIYSFLTIKNAITNEIVHCEGSFSLSQSGISPSSNSRVVNLAPGNYKWFVENGSRSWSRVASSERHLTVVLDLPETFALHQNFPNPFNPVTTIRYSLQESGVAKLAVYNLLGQKVVTLIDNEEKSSGDHGLTFDAGNLPSGIYYYRLESASFTETRKMLLLR